MSLIPEVLQQKVIECARRTIAEMELPYVGTMDVAIRDLDWDGIMARAGISLIHVKEVEGMGTTERDKIGYGVLVAMNFGTGRQPGETARLVTYCRKAIRGKFHSKRTCMTGADGVCDLGSSPLSCVVTNEDINIPDHIKKNRSFSHMILRFWFLEQRRTPLGE